jgi:iron complex outermembrane receptor protein
MPVAGSGDGCENGRHEMGNREAKGLPYLIAASIWFLIFMFLSGGGEVRGESNKEEEEIEERLEEIVVVGERLVLPTKQTGETVYTGTEITRKGIAIQGEKAKTNIYEAVNLLPGVSVETPAPYGLGAEQMNIRLRGVTSYLGAMTVEGIPNYGWAPIGPRSYVYDTENLGSIAVYKGAVPGDLGTGVGDRGGAVELRPRWAEEKLGFEFSQGLGSYAYGRTYLRVDSGALPKIGTRASLSYSYSETEKWKGPGEIGPRNNANFTLVQPLASYGEAKFWFNFNDLDLDKYRPLIYQETKDLYYRNYRKDFAEDLTGNPWEDIYYFKYNRASFTNREYFGFLTVKPYDGFTLSLKPYYTSEDARITEGIAAWGSASVQESKRDMDRMGLVAEVGYDRPALKVVLGYHFEAIDSDGYTKSYQITPSGLDFAGYGIYAKAGIDHINAPYLKLSGKVARLDWQAGMKYFTMSESDSKGYVTDWSTGRPVLVRAPDLDRDGRRWEIWLPTAGVAYNFLDNLQAYMSYGKNYIAPYAYWPLISYYYYNRYAFMAAGVTLDDLFKGYDFEESHNVDLGLRYRDRWFEVSPTLFYAKHKNLLTVVSDDRVMVWGKPASYYQNVGKATGYGLDLEMNLFPLPNLTLFANPTWLHLTYDKDISYQGETLETRHKQVVDTPKWLVKAGAIYRHGGFEVVPTLRYIGKRYGDALHKEAIGSYAVTDLRMSYTTQRLRLAREMSLGLELNNIFNKRYVAVIRAWDDSRAGEATYLVGAPFTALLTLSAKF